MHSFLIVQKNTLMNTFKTTCQDNGYESTGDNMASTMRTMMANGDGTASATPSVSQVQQQSAAKSEKSIPAMRSPYAGNIDLFFKKVGPLLGC